MRAKKIIPILATFFLTILASFLLVAFMLRPCPLDIENIDLNTVDDGEYI